MCKGILSMSDDYGNMVVRILRSYLSSNNSKQLTPELIEELSSQISETISTLIFNIQQGGGNAKM